MANSLDIFAHDQKLQWTLDITERQGTGKIYMFAITRSRCIEFLFQTFCYYWPCGDRISFVIYQGLEYIEFDFRQQ